MINNQIEYVHKTFFGILIFLYNSATIQLINGKNELEIILRSSKINNRKPDYFASSKSEISVCSPAADPPQYMRKTD
jgi:hypothetical protein